MIEFAEMALNENFEIFMDHIHSLIVKITIDSARKPQISFLFVEKIIFQAEYSDFMDVFLKKLTEILLKYTGVNEYAIK